MPVQERGIHFGGMGNTYAQAPARPYDDTLLHDVPGITRESHLGKGRFLKTLKVIHDEGTAVCKIFIKPTAAVTLDKQVARLQEIRDTTTRFMKNPNVCPYTTFIETDRAGYMIRQFFQNNLYDRFGTRPFLTTTEKTWITFQLLKAIEKSHFAGLCHGDLKTENVMITSWNWVFVTDFAPYKPTYIPDYNPADFSYFFDTSGRRSCYIAPERFQKAVMPHTPAGADTEGDQPASQTAPASAVISPPSDDSHVESLMDVFSLGCVIAELWLEGTPLFNLSDLLSYRNVSDPNRFSPASKINKIENEHVRKLITHMIQLNPEDRHSAGQYVKSWTPSLFPLYFHDLHTYMANLMDLEVDDRVKIIAQDFDALLAKFRVQPTDAQSNLSTPGALVRSNTATSAEMLRSLAQPVQLTSDDAIRAKELEARRLSILAVPPSFSHEMSAFPIGDPKKIDSQSVNEQLRSTETFILDLEHSLKTPPSSTGDTIQEDTTLQFLEDENQSIKVTDDPYQPESDLRNAFAYYKKKLADAKRSDDKSGIISAIESMSSVSRGLGDFARSRKYNTRLTNLASEISSFAALQRAHMLSGMTEFDCGDLQAASSHFEEAFKLAESLEDRTAQCQLAQRLAEVYSSFQIFDKVAFYQRLYSSLVQEIGVSQVSPPAGKLNPPRGTGNSISFHGRLARSKLPLEPDTPAPGFILVLSVLTSMLRALKEQQTRLLVLDTFMRIAPHVDDDIRLQRMVPYILSLLDADVRNSRSASLVTAHAIKALTAVLSLIRNFPPSDAHVFPEYILPSLGFVTEDETAEIVVQAFAESLPKLADTALRFLETSQFFRQRSHSHQSTLAVGTLGSSPVPSTPPSAFTPESPVGGSLPRNSSAQFLTTSATIIPTSSSAVPALPYSVFQREVDEIRNSFKDIVILMLRDDAPAAVKKAILSNISALCIFFGKDQTNDVLLPLIFSCLNSKDWELKCIVFENIVGVSAVAGPDHIESWILTCIPPQIHDESEFVVAGAVNCLASLSDLGIFKKHRMLEIVDKTAPLLLHPNTWIRYGAACIILSIGQKLSTADIICFLIPKIRRFLVRDIAELSRRTLLQSLPSPVSRRSYEKALNGTYSSNLMTIEQDMVIIEPEEQSPDPAASPRGPSNSTMPTNDSVDIPFSLAISELDLPADDEKKLFAMKEFIKVSAMKKRTRAAPVPEPPFHDEYRQISDRITVHEIPITAATSASLMGRDFHDQNEEWQDFFGKQSGSAIGTQTSSPGDRFSDGARDKNTESPTGTPGRPFLRKSDLYSFSSLKRKPTPSSPGSSLPGVKPDSSSQAQSRPATLSRPSNKDTVPNTPVPTLSSTPLASSTALHALPSNLVLPNIPKPPPELGPLAPGRIYNGSTLKNWRPSGVLVAHLHEHGGPVNEIQVTKDNLFFASASDDGTVKIWDCQRLEKNVTNRSRLTYSSQPGKIQSLCVCENSHSIASASSSGSIHVFRIERVTKREKSAIPEYTGMSTIQNLDLSEGAVVKVDHFDALSASQSLIVYATDAGVIHAWDLRSKKEAWRLCNKPELGLISTFFLSPTRQWMAIGTNRGFVSSWDIRFKVPFREWRLPDQSIVHHISSSGASSDGAHTSAFVASGPGDFAEWNLEAAQCSRLYRILSERTSKLPELRIGVNPLEQNDWGLSDLERPPRSFTRVRTIASSLSGPSVASAPSVGTANLKSPVAQSDSPNFVLSAGTDKKIRYWDLSNPKASYIISGLEKLEPKPQYHSYAAFDGAVDVLEEMPGAYQELIRPYDDTGLREPNLDPPPTAHRDTILDLKILESPSRLLVSSSRDGVIKVWK